METKQYSILLIGVSDENFRHIGQILETGGANSLTESAGSPSVFDELLQTRRWDLVVLEDGFPGESAAGSLQRIVAAVKRGTGDIPIVVVSVHNDDEWAQESIRGGAVDFLSGNRFGRLLPIMEQARRTSELAAELDKANEQLKLSESRRANFLNHLPAAIVAHRQGRIISVNDEALRILGATHLEQLEGKLLFDFLPRDFVDGKARAWREKVIKHEKAPASDWWVEGLDGKRRLIEAASMPGAPGDRVRALLVAREITERRRLESMSQRLGRILDASSDEIYVFDARNFRLVQVNQGARKNIGIDADFENMTAWDLLADHDEEAFRSLVAPLLGDYAHTLSMETRQRRTDGSTYAAAVKLQLFRSENPPVMVSIVEDVSERRREQQRVRDSERYVTAVVDSVSDGVIAVDHRGTIESFSRGAEEMFAYPAVKVVGSDASILFPNSWKTLSDTMQAAMLTAEESSSSLRFQSEVEGRKSDGQSFSAHISINEIEAVEGQVYSLVVRDITETKRAEEEQARFLERHGESQKLEAIGTLAGGIAHDFNNILAAIMGFAHSALLDLEEGSGTAEDIRRVIKSAERGANLTTKILDFNRRDVVDHQKISLADVVSSGAEMSRAVIPAIVQFELRLDAENPLILGDSTQWQQVILNLCLNASQAMGEDGGTIGIDLRRRQIGKGIAQATADLEPGNYLELRVADDGEGMTEKVRQRAFEPFFTSKPPGKGTGLGLAVVYGIVMAHKGAMTIESAPGKGTTITILVPGLDQPISEVVSETESGETVLDGTERILFVDDEAAICQSVSKPLGRLGYRVSTFTSSQEALAAFRAEPGAFDLVITDQMMPQLNGTGLAREIGAVRTDIPIVICSGFHPDLTVENVNIPNVKEVLTKPIAPRQLGQVIRDIMS